MTIRNLDVYVSQLWDWGFLDSCFGGTKIRVSDLDGIVERNGYFLIIEAKSSGARIPTGQKIMFDKFAAMPKCAVLVVWGEPNKPEMMQLWGEPQREATIRDVQDVVTGWFERANSGAGWCIEEGLIEL